MTTTAASNKNRAFLVELQYGDPSSPLFARYTTYTRSISVQGNLYQAIRGIAVRLPENTGTLDERPAEIDLPLSGLIDTITSGYPFSPVFVTIRERTFDASTEQVKVRFRGKLRTSTRCPNGRQNLATLEVVSWKGLLDSAMSLTSDHQCENTLGDDGCKIDLISLKRPGLIASIDGASATITGLPSQSDGYWHRGYIEYQGCRISIRIYTTGNIFYFAQLLPPSWLGATVMVAPGCDKLYSTCQSRYNNTDNFNGVGFATPRYNPNFETT